MATRSSKAGRHARKNSSLVPAVPQIFNKQGTRLAERSGATNGTMSVEPVATEELANGTHGNDKAAEASVQAQEVGVGSSRVDAVDAVAEEPSSTPKQTAAMTNLEMSPNHRPRVSLPRHTHYPSSASLPSAQNSQPGKAIFPPDSKSSMDIPAVMGQPGHNRNRSFHRIAFGSFGNPSESSESSPTLPLSATSTHYTQPTPASETRSQASRSENEYQQSMQVQEKPLRPTTEFMQGNGLVGPYPPGLMSEHAMDFLKYQHQFLLQYLQDLYGRNDGDIALEIRFKTTSITFNLHSAVLFQSPMLAKAIQQGRELGRVSSTGRTIVTLAVQDKFVSIPAIESVLKVMYGRPAFDIKSMNQPYLDPHMFYSQFAASCLLGVHGAQIYGMNCILDIVNWRTLADVFDLCLAGRTFPPTHDPCPRRSDEIVTILFQPHITRIFERALSVLIQEISQPSFVFDADAPNIAYLGGLPQTNAPVKIPASPSAARPGIVFGDLNVGDSTKYTVLSSLLLSLPVSVLQRVLAETSARPEPSVMELAIAERERRRISWSAAPSHENLAMQKEMCIPVDFLPNGIGIINDKS